MTPRALASAALTRLAAAGIPLLLLVAWSEPAAAAPACAEPRAGAAYTARVTRALRAGTDVWGNELLRAPGGPTYERARRYLQPLLYARGRGQTPLTASGVHYVPFSQPLGPQGAGTVALHVADGSQIVSNRIGGRSLTIGVGLGGRERYGSCVARLATPRLAGGLPILQTAYADAAGARYRQESFVARLPQTASLVSLLRLTVDASRARAAVEVRLSPSATGLRRDGERLERGGASWLVASPGAAYDGASLRYRVPRGERRALHAAWFVEPQGSRPLTLDDDAYAAARRSVADHWERALAAGALVSVPERRVTEAQRSLLIQNLGLTWRYSIGNAYEQFSFPEGVDVAQVLAEWGYRAVARSILRTSLTRRPTPYANWKRGEKLLGWAVYHRLHRDGAALDAATPALRSYVAALGRQIDRDPRGLLARERYSSDIPDSVYGLHSQAVVWQGLHAMADIWGRTGRPELAARCRALAARLERGLRAAVRASERRLPDGSLFLPVRLLDGETPYEALTASRPGSYWNLVAPYALASGLFPPGGREAEGALRYLLRHGSRLLGVVRAAAFALYRDPVFPTSGTDAVYGINAARFLADNDEADQLVLSLYGTLAAALTPGTFVSGEAASVAPLEGRRYRAMYLPPNAAANASFLATLRLLLVHETRDRAGTPRGLRLAFSTPRAWLRPGRVIRVERVPTSFGPLSYTLAAQRGTVRVSLQVPAAPAPRSVALRLRLPGGGRLTGVRLGGRPYARFDAASGTIDLGARRGALELVARYAARAGA